MRNQGNWAIKSLLLVLWIYNAFLCLQFLATIWAWQLANLELRMAILLSIADLSPPVLTLYTYFVSEKRIHQLCNAHGEADRPAASAVFHECTGILGLQNRTELRVIDEAFSHAFAFGRGGSGTVVLTRGLVDRLSTAELTGIVSHELAHIKNGDHSIMTWAESLVGVYRLFLPIYLILSSLIAWADIASGSGNPVWTLVNTAFKISMIFVFPTLLIDYLSRTREYVADFIANSITGTYPRALMKASENPGALAGIEKISLLSVPTSRLKLGLLSSHPPLESRITKVRARIAPSFRPLHSVIIGFVVAISSIFMIEIIPSSIEYVFALIPSLLPESQQMVVRMMLILSFSKYIETTIYAVEILIPAILLYFAIPSMSNNPIRGWKSAARGIATCVGLIPPLVYFILPEQAIALGGPFPIPKRIWPAPPGSYSSLLQAAGAYFAVLCLISILEWAVVPSIKSYLNSVVGHGNNTFWSEGKKGKL